MKKAIVFLLIALLLISFSACGSQGETDTESPAATKTENVSDAETSAETSEPDAGSEETSEPEEISTPDEDPETEQKPSPPSDPVSDHILELPKDLFEEGAPIAQIGEWVYYTDGDGMLSGRVHLDGSDRLRYENSGMRSPLISKDRIYYIDSNDGEQLYAMNPDGTDAKLICKDKVCCLDELLADGSVRYHVTDDPVEKYDPENDETYIDWGESRYYSVKPDGTDRKEYAFGGSPEPDGWLYTYVDAYSNRSICKMRPDGSEKTVLTEFEVDAFKVHDGWIYYTHSGEENGLFRVRTDGTGTEKLCDDGADVFSMAFGDTQIFYLHDKDRLGTLYAIGYDGTDRRKLSERPADGIFSIDSHLLAVQDTVFFTSEDPDALYAVKADGTDEQLVGKVDRFLLETDSGLFYEVNGRSFFYRFTLSQEPDELTEERTLPDFSSMALTEFFPEGKKYFELGADTFRVIDSYVRGDLDRIKTRYALDGNTVLPGQAPQNTIADYSDYCITQVSADSYEVDGRHMEKVTVSASLACTKAGQEGYREFRLEFVNMPGAFDWKLIRLDVQNGSKPTGEDTVPLTDSMTVRDFLSSAKCQELQAAAFNFINAYFGGDYEEVRRMFIAPSWALDHPDAWDSRSRDDYTGYGISWVSFEPYELDGEQVQKAHFHLSMYRAVPGEEGVYDPYIELVYVDRQWRILSLDFSA